MLGMVKIEARRYCKVMSGARKTCLSIDIDIYERVFIDWLQGDVVTLTRCVDNNWYEGKLAGRQGLFPVSYVEQLVDDDISPLPPSNDITEIIAF